jgi:hypothetical protein
MRIEKIINNLINHEIDKHEAVNQIREITEKLISGGGIEMVIESVSFTVKDDHGYLKLKKPYKFSEIKDVFNNGEKVKVILIP